MEPTHILDGYKIRFQPLHKDYGRAEFVVCPIWKRGRIVKVYITTVQQEPGRQFVVDTYSDTMSIQSWVGTGPPKIWLQGRCKEHKTYFTRFYVPADAAYMQVRCLSNFSLNFGKD
jgi:hypothetical protein